MIYTATMKRVIRTKYKTDQQGIPAEEFFAGVDLPAPIKGTGAKVYQPTFPRPHRQITFPQPHRQIREGLPPRRSGRAACRKVVPESLDPFLLPILISKNSGSK
jgi:hypothetical protein